MIVATASVPSEIDGIRRHMAQIRRELHEDVQGVVAGAEAVTDWKRYVRLYPWACVGVALGAGYLLAPRRRRKAVATPQVVALVPGEVHEAVREAKEQVKAEVRSLGKAPIEKKEEKAGFVGMIAGLVGPMLLRGAKNYAMTFAEQWLAQKVAAGQNPLAFLQGIPGMPDLSAVIPPGPSPFATGPQAPPPGPGQPPYGPGQPPYGSGPQGPARR